MSLSGRSASTWPEPLNELLPLLAKLASMRLLKIFIVPLFVSKQYRTISPRNIKDITLALFRGTIETFAAKI